MTMWTQTAQTLLKRFQFEPLDDYTLLCIERYMKAEHPGNYTLVWLNSEDRSVLRFEIVFDTPADATWWLLING